MRIEVDHLVQWYLRTPIEDGEVLSSWLIRSSLDLGCSPLTLIQLLWGKWRGLTVDIDRGLSDERLDILLNHCFEHKEKIYESMLNSYLPHITSQYQNNKQIIPWVLVLGIRNRSNILGRQVCTQCLNSSDQPPYLRFIWRFGWNCGCIKHKTLLIDHCPNCGSSIQFSKVDMEHGSLAVCTLCYFDFRNALPRPVNPAALSFQQKADIHLEQKFGVYDDQLISSNEWFEIARAWLSFIRTSMTTNSPNFLNMLQSLDVVLPLDFPITPLAFEFLNVKEREKLLIVLDRLMSLPCDVLIKHSIEYGISQAYFWDKRKKLPSQLEVMKSKMLQPVQDVKTKAISDIQIKPKTKQSVQRKWLRLLRKYNYEWKNGLK